MKVAVVGTGISGMVAAHELSKEHVVDVYESRDRLGGHTNTVDVRTSAGNQRVDTGFIVFNERTYPEFCGLMKKLGVAWQESDMSFSVRCDATGLEYNGTDLNRLFAQRTNLLRPSFWRMVRDILRFYREAPALLDQASDDLTLGRFLQEGGYSDIFVQKHMIPMGAAIWSATPATMQAFPMRFLVQFFHNHGFLQVNDRPQWLVIRGGSETYIRALTRSYADRIRLATPVTRLTRESGGVRLRTQSGHEELYDRVVLATHSDISLRMLGDATPLEREILSAFRYQPNEALLHTDASIMPKRQRAWASWNYHVTQTATELPTVTYWMNLLQSLPVSEPLLVTLNRGDAIDPAKVLRRFTYHHPIFSTAAVRAQARHGEIDGQHGIHFCGAYWGYGFHEDGVKSALAVVKNFARELVA